MRPHAARIQVAASARGCTSAHLGDTLCTWRLYGTIERAGDPSTGNAGARQHGAVAWRPGDAARRLLLKPRRLEPADRRGQPRLPLVQPRISFNDVMSTHVQP